MGGSGRYLLLMPRQLLSYTAGFALGSSVTFLRQPSVSPPRCLIADRCIKSEFLLRLRRAGKYGAETLSSGAWTIGRNL